MKKVSRSLHLLRPNIINPGGYLAAQALLDEVVWVALEDNNDEGG